MSDSAVRLHGRVVGLGNASILCALQHRRKGRGQRWHSNDALSAKFGEDAFFLKNDIITFGAELGSKPANPDYVEKQHVFGDKLRSGFTFVTICIRGVNGVVICT